MAARIFWDTWDPSYGASFDSSGGAAPSAVQVTTDIELPAPAWRPLGVAPTVRAPDVVLMVDGVRRMDASFWTGEDDGTSFPGVAASYAAGVVRCDLRRGAAELVGARVERALFSTSATIEAVAFGNVRYVAHQLPKGGDAAQLLMGMQKFLTALEVGVSTEARADLCADDDLLVVDGPLRKRRQLHRTIGYVKRQETDYLEPALMSTVTALRPGERSPVFLLGGPGAAFTWYLRLPIASRAPRAGIVRIECSPDLTPQAAIGLADLSLVTLPRFASTPYKDPRAPQNLMPIAGLERKLRSLLGDARLLNRHLTVATAAEPALA